MRLLVCAIVAVSLPVLAGCGTNKAAGGASALTAASGGSPGTTLPPSIGTSGSPSAGTATTHPTSTATNPPAPTTYPSSAQAYTTDAINAYANHDDVRLAAYTTKGGLEEFDDIERVSGPWHFHNCFADGDNAACTFDNPIGDRLTVDVIPADMHQPHGVSNVVLDKTAYENDAASMVEEFISAWNTGNVYRMAALSAGNAASKVSKLPTPSATMLSVPDTTKSGHTIYSVNAIGTGVIVLDVDNSLLGHAHAITLVSIS